MLRENYRHVITIFWEIDIDHGIILRYIPTMLTRTPMKRSASAQFNELPLAYFPTNIPKTARESSDIKNGK